MNEMESKTDAMTPMERMKAGLEYTYADAELIARKTQAIEWCEEFNAIDGRDYSAQYAHLKRRSVAIVARTSSSVTISRATSILPSLTFARCI